MLFTSSDEGVGAILERYKEYSKDFEKNFTNIKSELERLLTALIFRGIKYNQFLVKNDKNIIF